MRFAIKAIFGAAILAGAACSAVDEAPATEAGLNVPSLSIGGGHTGPGGEERPYVLASLRTDVPASFTGCIDDTAECYVLGEAVDVEVRYEPQSGRYWFMDPVSGNTYFVDGELRTGDPGLAERKRPLRPEAKDGDLVLGTYVEPAEDEEPCDEDAEEGDDNACDAEDDDAAE
ncbi:hypothetical protein HK107_14165 [Parvularcula sp. ZS-1/3]|uniref:Lipoprotein n=1 Tax=Parvularcula mediterranea TaxID=2732508 RepID=A0A7Y3RNQ7_9PROT|nr:hypothetical protein [Parvularcula mediterranea]NNU17474.1 hypothetical protein [Parvularcula mediterranea]